MEKVIFLDPMFLFLPKIKAISKENLELNRELNEVEKTDRYSAKKRYLEEVRYSTDMIEYINRACVLTGAKIVVFGEMTKYLSKAEILEKLIKEGVEKSAIHNHCSCDGSYADISKLEQYADWIDRFDVNREGLYLVLNQSLQPTVYKNVLSLEIDKESGIKVDDYRMIAGYLGANDLFFKVFQIERMEDVLVDSLCGNNKKAKIEFLYSVKTINAKYNRSVFLSAKGQKLIYTKDSPLISGLPFNAEDCLLDDFRKKCRDFALNEDF